MKIVNLKELRKSKNISQKHLAKMIGKTPGFVSNVENGRSGVSEDTVVDICNTLGVSREDLSAVDEITSKGDKVDGLLKIRDLLFKATPTALKNIKTMLDLANQHRISNREIITIINHLLGGKDD